MASRSRRLLVSLLRIAKQFPYDPAREGRNLGVDGIKKRVLKLFRENAQEIEKAKIRVLTDKGYEELKALQVIKSDHFMKKYPVQDVPIPRVTKHHGSYYLSNEYLESLEPKPSPLVKLFSFIVSRFKKTG
eukprot:TRINITY_DN9453_c0_g1_i1.p1 TRINITY_DN9453_c0_g1~~TRINITY_DN9453_c0_g1_i1.p1  ORF type:complete len:131 (+),score=28.30 TRINITY_DN9453_c0_g1_i1:87-479(+)